MKKMKKILLLLLFTIASYGQAVFDEGIQITGNANSATATKVNVQEANGKVNTQTINTAFNKNFGLNTGDVVGATTLLNQYSTTPIDWTSTSFSSGQVVFYGGKQWIAKMATVAGDVPAVSSKWDEITFEALANKTVTVDQTIIDGSTNSVSGNAVFDGLVLKAPLASPSLTGTPTAPTATAGANTTQVATTAFVTNGIAATDSQNVKLTGNQNVGGIKTFGSTIFSEVIPNYISILNNQSSISNNGIFGVQITRRNGLISLLSSTSSTKEASLNTSSFTADRAFIFPNQDGTFALTSNPTSITATSFIKSSAPTTNLLLAGGGDIAQSTFQPAITGLTTNYLPKWNGSGFGNSSIFDNGTNIGIGTTNPAANLTVKGAYSVGSSIPTNWALLSAGRMGVAKNNKGLYIDIYNDYAEVSTYDWSLGQAYPMVFQGNGGNTMFGTNVDNGSKVQVNGTISASPATTGNQVVVKSQLDAAASSGSYTPTGNVITGATSVSVQSHTYIKIGNIVTVYGESKPAPVVTGVTVIYEISLPIARANTVTKALGFGSINVAGGSTNQFVRLESLSATTVRISFNVNAAGTPSILYSFQYDITQ